MKRTIIILAILFLFASDQQVFSQGNPPPPPGHMQNGTQNGGSAPIGGGLGVMTGASLAYGLYKLRKRKLDQRSEIDENSELLSEVEKL